MGFPKKYAGRSDFPQPITGRLDKAHLAPEHTQLIERIVCGLFLDMQDKPLTEVLTACYLTGINHAQCVQQEYENGKPASTDQGIQRIEPGRNRSDERGESARSADRISIGPFGIPT